MVLNLNYFILSCFRTYKNAKIF